MARLQAILLLALALFVVMAAAHQQQGLFGSVDLPEGAMSTRLSDLVQRRSLLGKNKYMETYTMKTGHYGYGYHHGHGYGYGYYGH
ncbi:hypothetical protein WJX73_002717 [Symbiochloris irregularis]|uniref:Uncharacterized protein n=1 Tax=Symbiochloris irregularis TaxID=706552 RepID=A0AAW1NW05_9CHLO